MTAHVGAQVQPVDWLHFGVALRLPVLLLVDRPDTSTLLHVGVEGADPDTGEPIGQSRVLFEDDRPAAGVGMLEPMRLMLGAGAVVNGTRLSLGFDFSPGLQSLDVRRPGAGDPDFLVDRELVWNLRAGALVPLGGGLGVGAGAFTDRSAERTPTEFGVTKVDYYGGTLGLRLDTPVRLARSERAESLIFRSEIAARYAYGSGQTPTLRFEFDDALPFPASGEAVDLQFHEVYVFVASSVLF